MSDKTMDRTKVNGTTYLFKDTAAQEALSEIQTMLDGKTLNWKRYLTSSDSAIALKMGAYGISSSASSRPSNLPTDFPSAGLGTVIALERGGSGDNAIVYFAFAHAAKAMWYYTGYEWCRIATDGDVESAIDDALTDTVADIYEDLVPVLQHLAEDSYAPGEEVTSTKTQFRFLGQNGPTEVADTYTDWYVTNSITVTPMTFYCVKASAQYASHDLYQILDEADNIIHRETIPGSAATYIDGKVVLIPGNGAKIRIASITGSSGAALYATVEKSASRKWVGKKWVCIGDSLTDTNARTTMHYHDYIADKTGITVVNLGHGGTGYKQTYAGYGPFIEHVDEIPLDADVVTIFGSGNDATFEIGEPGDTGTDSLCSAINATIEAIFDRITTCQLGIVTPTPWDAYNPADDTNWMAQYSAAIVEICRRWGIPCLDLYHCSNLRPWDSDFRAAAYSKDEGHGVHPDETGHALFAPRFEAFVESLLLH